MNRTLQGKFNVIGIYRVGNTKALFILPGYMAKFWENKKGNEAIALIWNSKLYFRKIYYRRDGACFKFFNHIIYLKDIMICNEVLSFEYE